MLLMAKCNLIVLSNFGSRSENFPLKIIKLIECNLFRLEISLFFTMKTRLIANLGLNSVLNWRFWIDFGQLVCI